MGGSGRLTTHAFDTAAGLPAAGVELRLLRWYTGAGAGTVVRTRTNAEGGTDEPLLAGGSLRRGHYELTFEIGAYFAAQGIELPDPPFLQRVSLHFGVADPNADYHVPLLASPWSYATCLGGVPTTP